MVGVYFLFQVLFNLPISLAVSHARIFKVRFLISCVVLKLCAASSVFS